MTSIQPPNSNLLPSSWQSRLPFFYGWTVVGLAVCFSFFGIGVTWAASILAIPMMDELGWSRSDLFFAVSLRGWTGIVAAPLIGRYLDRERGAQLLALAGGVLNAGSLVLIAFASEQWQFILLFGLVGGVAQTAQSGVTIAIVPKWFILRRGSAVAYSTLGGGIAAFAMPAMLAPLNDELGWRASWAVVAALAFVFACLPALLLRRQPEDVGLLPDGEKVAYTPAEAVTPRPNDDGFTLREAMSSRSFWLLMVGVSVGSLACNGVPANFTSMFVDRGHPLEVASTALIAYGVGSMLAKFTWGAVANRFHIRGVLLALVALGIVSMPSLLAMPGQAGATVLVYGFLVGFFVGAYVPLHQLVWAAYFGRAHVGAISGIGRPLGVFFISAGPFMMAALHDVSGNYDSGLLVTTAALVVCALCIYLARAPVRKAALVVAEAG